MEPLDRKRLHPVKKALGLPIREVNSLERAGFQGLTPGDPEPLYPGPGCRGRRHLRQEQSRIAQFRPCRRPVPAMHDATHYPPLQGTRTLEEYRPVMRRRPERVHVREPIVIPPTDEEVREMNKREPKWAHKHNVIREDGTYARDRISLEQSLEKDMGKKGRVSSQRVRRNGVPCVYGGDKNVQSSEYCPGYFYQPRPTDDRPIGWRPMPSDAKTVTRVYEGSSDASVNYRPRFSYGDKRAIFAYAHDIRAVRQLQMEDPEPDDD